MQPEIREHLARFERVCAGIADLNALCLPYAPVAAKISMELDMAAVSSDDPRRVFKAPARWIEEMAARGFDRFMGLRLEPE